MAVASKVRVATAVGPASEETAAARKTTPRAAAAAERRLYAVVHLMWSSLVVAVVVHASATYRRMAQAEFRPTQAQRQDMPKVAMPRAAAARTTGQKAK